MSERSHGGHRERYWHSLNRNGAVNVVSSSTYGGMGHSPTFSDNLVEVGLAT